MIVVFQLVSSSKGFPVDPNLSIFGSSTGSKFLGTFFGGAIGGLIYNIYDLNSVFLFTIFIAIIWWFLILTLPLKTITLEE